jgi:hypothetical protein
MTGNMTGSMTDSGDGLERLLEDEEALRDIGFEEGAQGKNGSDYRKLYDIWLKIFEFANTIKADPQAFQFANGAYNDKMINAYSKLMGLAMKGMTDLNRMRNTDRMVARMLSENSQNLAQSVSIELGLELKAVIEAIDRGETSDEVAIRLKRIMYRKVPEIFLKSASEALTSTRESYGLLQ